MLAIYYTISEMMEIGEVIVQGTINNMLDCGIGFMEDINFNNRDDETEQMLENKSNPHVLDEFSGGYVNFLHYAASDPDGTDVLFFINNANNSYGFDTFDFEDRSSKSEEKLASDNNFIYVGMGTDTKEEISSMLSELLIQKGFDITKVESKLTKLINDTENLDEYTINSYARSIFNTHLLNSPDSNELTEKDFHKIAVRKKREMTTESPEKSKIVGLENERNKINGVIKMLDFEKKRRDKGLSGSFNGCNMVFAGPPGTAKTTLAREFAAQLEKLGLITSAHNFKECKKSDIVGAYVGWTAKQVDEMFTTIAESGGGVIFFDEIYTISEKDSTCFDKEAVTCIVQNMENFRDKVYCVFAGYENKMDEFLSANPGIRSRIHFIVKFGHYDNELLSKVFNCIAESNSYIVPEDCTDSLNRFFSKLKEIRGDQFGNGREARNLFTNTQQKMASRLYDQKRLSKRSLTHFTKEDIDLAIEDILGSEIAIRSNKSSIHIGF